jgi:hypothetical protein
LSQPLLLAVFGDHPQSGLNAGLRGGTGRDLADAYSPGAHFVEAEQAADQLRPPRADESRESENLAATKFQRNADGGLASRHAGQREDRLARLMGNLGKKLFNGATDHEGDDLLFGSPRQLPGADGASVAEHGVIVADFPNFLEKMADVDDAEAFLLQPSNHLKELLGIVAGEGTGRLVEDDDLGVGDEGAGDFNQLLRGDGQVANDGAGLEPGVTEPFEGLSHPGSLTSVLDESPAGQLLPEHDVVFDGEMGGEVQLLIDHGDAGLPGGMGAIGGVRPTCERHTSGVWSMGAAEDFHEGALAGPVFADQGQHSSGLDGQRHVGEGLGGAEPLGDAGHGEEGRVRHDVEHGAEGTSIVEAGAPFDLDRLAGDVARVFSR